MPITITQPRGGGGGGGEASGGTVLSTAYASRPAAGTAGNLFLPSDGFQVERDTGSAWAPWGPLYPFTAPPLTGWTWINQGGATVGSANGGLIFTAPANASAGWRVYSRTAPGTPYTIDVAFSRLGFSGQHGVLAGWTDGTALAGAMVWNNSGLCLASCKYTNTTTFSANYSNISVYGDMTPLWWIRIADNGTNRIISTSPDGVNYVQFHSISRTDFLTPSSVCFGLNPNDGTYGQAATMYSWKVG